MRMRFRTVLKMDILSDTDALLMFKASGGRASANKASPLLKTHQKVVPELRDATDCASKSRAAPRDTTNVKALRRAWPEQNRFILLVEWSGGVVGAVGRGGEGATARIRRWPTCQVQLWGRW